jgi:hypothetical protein
MDIREVFARNLRKRRHAAKLSQEELAHRAEIDRTYISALERSVYAASIDGSTGSRRFSASRLPTCSSGLRLRVTGKPARLASSGGAPGLRSSASSESRSG